MQSDNNYLPDDDRIRISIVIPVYNTEKYLDDMFASLLDQGFCEDEYEIICVNDGSKDSSLEILSRYASKHRCIKVISQENAGQSAARNVGLHATRGKYVCFVDSDDFIDTNALKFIADSMDEHNIDEVNFLMESVPGDATYKHNEKQFIYTESDAPAKKNSMGGAKVYRRKFISENNIIWDPRLVMGEDLLFLYQFSLFSKKKVFLNSVVYYWRQLSNSTSHSRNEAAYDKRIKGFEALAEIYREIYDNPPVELTKKQKKELETKISLSVQELLFALAVKGDRNLQEEKISLLKEKGLYPYKHIMYDLVPRVSFKRVMLDCTMFLFPNEKMYYALSKVIKKLK